MDCILWYELWCDSLSHICEWHWLNGICFVQSTNLERNIQREECFRKQMKSSGAKSIYQTVAIVDDMIRLFLYSATVLVPISSWPIVYNLKRKQIRKDNETSLQCNMQWKFNCFWNELYASTNFIPNIIWVRIIF